MRGRLAEEMHLDLEGRVKSGSHHDSDSYIPVGTISRPKTPYTGLQEEKSKKRVRSIFVALMAPAPARRYISPRAPS